LSTMLALVFVLPQLTPSLISFRELSCEVSSSLLQDENIVEVVNANAKNKYPFIFIL